VKTGENKFSRRSQYRAQLTLTTS